MDISDKKLFTLLVEPGYVEKKDFLEAQKKRDKTGRKLNQILLDQGLILDEQIGQLWAEDQGWFFVDLKKEKIDEKLLEKIPEVMARSQNLIAFSRTEKEIKVAMLDPSDHETIHNLEKRFDSDLKVFFATENDLLSALRYYKKNIKKEIMSLVKKAESNIGLNKEKDESVIKIVDLMIQHGFYNRSSDIHLEPLSDHVAMRFRIDGVMHVVANFPFSVYDSLLRRIKILSKLRTDEQRMAQDGKFSFRVDGDEVDVRVSVMPVTRGENVVMRLLTSTNQRLALETLGFSVGDYAIAKSALAVPHGMILVTGPTGSGKTTTLYEFVKTLNTEEIHIASIEDPVEYDVEGVSQIQVNTKANLTFAKGLRAIVRQDPDVIMVGEIRDEETAKIAVNSAMTGHLVLSTLHTNDSATTLPRLLDMGIEPYLISSTVNVVIAQRLARKICEKCRYSYAITDKEKTMIKKRPELKTMITEKMQKKIENLTLFKGEGCRVCSESGFGGRLGIFELLQMTEAIKELVMHQANSSEITNQAISEGMTSLIEDGLKKAFSGETTIDEVLRITSGLS